MFLNVLSAEQFICKLSLQRRETRCELAVMSAESVSAFGHWRVNAATFTSQEKRVKRLAEQRLEAQVNELHVRFA